MDEFRPEASVDFEALAQAAAAAMTNGDGPHYTPPPETPAETPPPIRRVAAPAAGPSLGLDPFKALEQIVGDQQLMFRELGDIDAKLSQLQLQTILMFGGALLLAVLAYKLAKGGVIP